MNSHSQQHAVSAGNSPNRRRQPLQAAVDTQTQGELLEPLMASQQNRQNRSPSVPDDSIVEVNDGMGTSSRGLVSRLQHGDDDYPSHSLKVVTASWRSPASLIRSAAVGCRLVQSTPRYPAAAIIRDITCVGSTRWFCPPVGLLAPPATAQSIRQSQPCLRNKVRSCRASPPASFHLVRETDVVNSLNSWTRLAT